MLHQLKTEERSLGKNFPSPVHESGRFQKHQQLINIKTFWSSKSCGLPAWVIAIAALCLFLWTINLVFGISVDKDTRGTFGDTFGAVNSIFSAFALIGIAWGISQQRQQLSQTKEELDITKDGREETRRIFRDQQNNLKQERFETTFFQLFSAFQDLTASLSVKDDREFFGKGAFKIYLMHLNNWYNVHINQVYDAELEGVDDLHDLENFKRNFSFAQLGILHDTYSDFFDRYGDDLGRYFRSLYTIIKYVDESPIEKDKKYFYCKLLRAQLTAQESALLAINIISGYSTKSFNELIFKYGMAKNADFNNKMLSYFLTAIPFAAFGKSFVDRLIELGALPNVHGASGKSDVFEYRVEL